MYQADPQSLRHGRRGDLDQLTLEEDLPAIRPDDTVDDFHEGGFAGTVLARDGVDLALAQLEIHRAQGADRPEGFADLRELQDQIVFHGGTHSSNSASVPPG